MKLWHWYFSCISLRFALKLNRFIHSGSKTSRHHSECPPPSAHQNSCLTTASISCIFYGFVYQKCLIKQVKWILTYHLCHCNVWPSTWAVKWGMESENRLLDMRDCPTIVWTVLCLSSSVSWNALAAYLKPSTETVDSFLFCVSVASSRCSTREGDFNVPVWQEPRASVRLHKRAAATVTTVQNQCMCVARALTDGAAKYEV